jgi:hypothetical protein
MDACPLLITNILAVKPEDQGTFFQDFLGLSGYLCSIGGWDENMRSLINPSCDLEVTRSKNQYKFW